MACGKSGVLSIGLLLAVALPAFANPHVHRGPTAPHVYKTKTSSSSGKARTASVRGIEPERATQIQTALIKAGYLSGTPSGVWDAQSEAAMQKLQADNGWQTKLVPDARAIIKLGLGPNTPSGGVIGTSATDPSEPGSSKGEAGPSSPVLP